MSFPETYHLGKLDTRCKPANEAGRLREIQELEIFGVDAIPEIDRITSLANRIIGADDVGIHVVGESRQYLLSSNHAIPKEKRYFDRNGCCANVVLRGEPLVINDIEKDERFNQNEQVKEHGVKSYVGIPLTTERGHVLGTLCAYNWTERKEWGDEKLEMMKEFAVMAERALQLRKATLKSFKDAQAEEIKSNKLIEEKRTRAQIAASEAESSAAVAKNDFKQHQIAQCRG
eukprot:TRINITY_DN3070_c0_g3_i2.p1 TRINITY_DN3070_c0_g3~~TRINITY_DN3070_c0_g3_i2.p1  ORF type:complete len:231 (-),score=44.66 TRINITY_DN3070_c0_g3_i2:16-708(-)